MKNSLVSNLRNGLYLDDNSKNNLISNNTITDNVYHGIRLGGSSDNNHLTDNILSKNAFSGIYNAESEFNTFSFNDISENYYGVYLEESQNILIENNTIMSNEIDIGLSGADDSSIYHNNLGSINMIGENDGNKWNGMSEDGNFWSTYGGEDDGSGNRIALDGIGDTDLPHNGVDEYPFMEGFGWRYPMVPQLTMSEYDADGDFDIDWFAKRSTQYVLQQSQFPSPLCILLLLICILIFFV